MKEEKSNIDFILTKAFFILLLVASFVLVNQQSPRFEKNPVVTTELSTLHQANSEAIAVSFPEIPSFEFNWTFGSNNNFMAQDHLELRNFYCEINLAQKQKYFQVLFLSFKKKLDKQNLNLYHSQSKETTVSYSA